MFRRPALIIALVFLGALLGALAGRLIATRVQTRIGDAELEAYSQRLVLTGERLTQEAFDAHKAMSQSPFAFCSADEIKLMQRVIFGSYTIKEIERIRNGQIECTSTLGPLEHPQRLGHPDVEIGVFKAYFAKPVGSSGGSPAYISQWPDDAVATNPAMFQNLDEPPMTSTGRYYSLDSRTQRPRITNIFGHEVPLSTSEQLAGKLLERGGIAYLPRCVPKLAFCMIAAEPRQIMFTKTHHIRVMLIWAGTLAGALLSLLPISFLRSQRTMENQLRRAIRSGTLRLVYQPIVDLDRNVIVGAEVLARWKDESGESVRPDVFIGLAEERGFISLITDYVIDQALREMHSLLVSGSFHVSINIAAQDLADPGFCARIESKLKSAQVKPSAVALELTERSTANNENAIEALAYLNSAGHDLYLDDFGTGYSSLAYLHKLKVSAIKIDRSFTQTIGTEAIAAALVPQILAIAAELNLTVVVEGIETQEQLEYFRNARPGIFGQGFFLGSPMPASEFKSRISTA